MTEPGYVAPPAPGWWVRTNRIGVNANGYNWAVTVTGGRAPKGAGVCAYGWVGSAVGTQGVGFGAAGAASSGSTSNPVTFSHVGTAGEIVIVDVAVDRISATVATYDGVAMKYLGRMPYVGTATGTSAILAKYSIPITAGNAGTKTISITNPAGGWITAESTSYTKVAAVGVPRFVSGSGTAMSQVVTCPPGGMVEQAFAAGGNTTITHTGGTSRYLFATGLQPMGIRDTAVSDTFAGTISASFGWGGGAVALFPTPMAGPSFDAVGGMSSANLGAGVANFSGPVVVAGADVIVDIMTDRPAALTAVTYDSVTMTLLNSVSFTGAAGNSSLSRYRVTGVAGGSKTVSFTLPGGFSGWVSASVGSFTGVTSVATTTTASGAASAPSQSATCAANQLIVQTFGLTSALTGNGTFTAGPANLWDTDGGIGFAPTLLNLADVSSTFGSSQTNTGWGGLATVLS